MLFLQISKHNPESCPLHNEAVKKATEDLMAKMDQLLKKHRIKMIGGWNAPDDHSVVVVYDVPSLEAIRNFSMEPEVMIWSGYHTTEMKMVMTFEEAMKTIS